MTAAWFCELHRITTTGDCPRCDAEQVADLGRVVVMPDCRVCQRTFLEGESGWVEDVKVIEPGRVRLEQRYTCDDCEAAK